ncbi:hypothetical protein HDV00_011430 [Rhizophlyctis rosea]|nr:hypothetical protein HDV00_011430 [Rhizophlyctis rosea]
MCSCNQTIYLSNTPTITFSDPPVEILEAFLNAIRDIFHVEDAKRIFARELRAYQHTISVCTQLNKAWRRGTIPRLYEAPVLANLDQFQLFLASVKAGTTRTEPTPTPATRRDARITQQSWDSDEPWGGQPGWNLGGVGWESSNWTKPRVIKSDGWVPLEQWIVDMVSEDTASGSGDGTDDSDRSSDSPLPEDEETHDDGEDLGVPVAPSDPSHIAAAESEHGVVGVGSFIKRIDLSALRFVTARDVKALADHIGPRLKHLDLSTCVTITDSAVISIVEHTHQTLTHIRLTDNPQLTDLTLNTISTLCRHLTHLHLERLNRITNEGFYSLCRYSRSLTSLSIVQMRNLTDKAVVRWARRRGGQLERLCVARCGVADDGLEFMARGCGAALKDVTVAISHCVTEQALRAFAGYCRELERVTIMSTDVREFSVSTDDLITIFRPLHNIRTLALYGSVNLTEHDVQRIADGIPQLKFLNCFCWHAMTEEFRDKFNARQPPDRLRVVLDDGT